MLDKIVDVMMPKPPVEIAREQRDESLRVTRIKQERAQRSATPFCQGAHDFVYTWENNYRRCRRCPYREFQFGCWSNHEWKPEVPQWMLAANMYKAEHEPYYYSRGDHRLTRDDIDPNLTIPVALLRQQGSVRQNMLHTQITLVGAGGIGSWTGLVLAKMGFQNMRIYDGDSVQVENLGTQVYGMAQININKAATLRDTILANWLRVDNANNGKVAVSRKFQSDSNSEDGVVIAAVDSMAARKLVWEKHRRRPATEWFLDARMGGEYAVIYIVNPNDEDDIAMYEKSLFPDSEAYEDPCVARATVFTGMLIAGWIGKALRDALSGRPNYPRITRWDIQNNELNVYTKADSQKPRLVAQTS